MPRTRPSPAADRFRGEASLSHEPKTAVLGLGNVLMRDDAVGPYAVRVLEARYEFPGPVTVRDLGTPGLDLHPYLTGQQAIVIVDTVRAPAPPGEVRLYRRDALLDHPPPSRVSPHDPGVKEALLSMEFATGTRPEVLLVGVVPAVVDAGVGLSEPVRASLPRIEAEVVGELRRLGHRIRRRVPPSRPDLWWERAPESGR